MINRCLCKAILSGLVVLSCCAKCAARRVPSTLAMAQDVRLSSVEALTKQQAEHTEAAVPKKYTETVTTEYGEKPSFEMVLIPGGNFLMGSPARLSSPKSERGFGREDDESRPLPQGRDEGPQHEVRLDAFYLCRTETTLELFLAYYEEIMSSKGEQAAEEQAKKNGVDAITRPTPVYGDLTMGYSKKHPAMGMTWHHAMTFCKWLSKKTGKKYRLPTEAEWEYACRAGTTNVFGFGNDANQLKDYAWYKANSEAELHETATKKPNAWGLYDMLGNACEWVYDFYSTTSYTDAAKKKPAVNPTGPKKGTVHVARGGTWDSPADELRCAARGFQEPWWQSMDPQWPKSKWWLPQMDFIGFRVARSIDPNEQHVEKKNDGKD